MIIVTGATGFVGQELSPKVVKLFGKKNVLFLVYNKDAKDIPQASHEYLKKIEAKIKYVDLTKKSTLKNLPKNPSLIIHLAANTNTSLPNHGVNDIGTINLYKAFGKLNQNTHFIHIGTMIAVSGRLNCKIPIDESTPDYPTNEYTRTKHRGEDFIAQKCKKDKFRLTILRPNTIYGKGMRKGNLFNMLTNEIGNKSIISKINWPGRSALIHVDDVVKNIMHFTKKLPEPGKPDKYLLYSENYSISQLISIICKTLEIHYKPIILPKIVWSFLSYSRRFVPPFENFLPPAVYNQLWRASLIVDDVVYCKSTKLSTKKNKKLKGHIIEALT